MKEETEGNELVVIETKDIETIFKEGGCDPIIEGLKKEAAKFKGDVTTAKGRKEIASFARKFSTSKVYVCGLGKALSDKLRAKIAPINVERNKIETCCDELRDSVRLPLTEWEDAEKKRVADIEERIESIKAKLDIDLSVVDSGGIKAILDSVKAIVIDDSFEEFELAATKAKDHVLTHLKAKFIVRQNSEKEAAEAKRLEDERLEKERIEREEAIAKEAEEKGKREAEEKAEEDQKEKDRLAKEEIEKANREKLEAELATKKVEDEKREAAEQAERDKKQAIEDERKRVKEENKKAEAEDLKRQKDKKHRGKINKEAKLSFVTQNFNDAEAERIVTLIAKGLIKNVSIKY